jgi:hypothetical protein
MTHDTTDHASADQPASIPTAALAFAGTIAPAIGYYFALDSAGVVVLSALIMGAAGLAVAIYLNKTTTSNTSPVVAEGTPVAIEGTATTVTAEIPPVVDTSANPNG